MSERAKQSVCEECVYLTPRWISILPLQPALGGRWDISEVTLIRDLQAGEKKNKQKKLGHWVTEKASHEPLHSFLYVYTSCPPTDCNHWSLRCETSSISPN